MTALLSRRSVLLAVAVSSLLFLSLVASTEAASPYTTFLKKQEQSPREIPMTRATFVAVLPLRNRDLLESSFWSISDPTSKSYAQYLSRDEIEQSFGPLPADVDALRHTMEEHYDAEDVRVIGALGHVMCVRCLVTEEWALQGQTTYPAVSDVLKEGHGVDLVWFRSADCYESIPSYEERRRNHKVKTQGAGSKSSTTFTPSVQRELYGIPASLVGTNETNQQMVYGAGTYGYLESDLKSFYSKFNVDEDISLVSTVGFQGVPGGDNFYEATLDIQYITGIAPGIKSLVVNNNNTKSADNGPVFGYAMLDWMTTLAAANDTDIPYVLSLSLGSMSYDSCAELCNGMETNGYSTFAACMHEVQYETTQVCQFTSADQTSRIEDDFKILGTRGVSIFAASGDGGVHFSFQEYSGVAHSEQLNEVACGLAQPTFPSESSYVISVGGTMLGNGGVNDTIGCSAETGCIVTSGGGVSWSNVRPSYQTTLGDAYASTLGNLSFAYNVTNRFIPDIAFIATDVPIVVQGSVQILGGTSCSAPEAAGFFSLINDARLNKGMPPLGFLNPRLYQVAEASPSFFSKCSEGNNRCGDSANGCCDGGFSADASNSAYNAMCGLGTPKFQDMMSSLGPASGY
eukprot:TRINITY_DN1958_c0_g1_i1.p1 TRINITY_DN1958_c0_g1~~TRINITY_DN1958_c0_g1_i1.p1  ORF type:complete len:639 (-),score=152.97 TRINITY_DN1958_c0_g1_i1:1584-3470(-)